MLAQLLPWPGGRAASGARALARSGAAIGGRESESRSPGVVPCTWLTNALVVGSSWPRRASTVPLPLVLLLLLLLLRMANVRNSSVAIPVDGDFCSRPRSQLANQLQSRAASESET